MSNAAPLGRSDAVTQGSASAGTHLAIDVSYDSSVTDLNTPGNAAYNPTLYQDYTSAVQTAVQFYENEFTNPITIDITFGWGEVDGTPISGFAAESRVTSAQGYTYTQVHNAVKAAETTSAVQMAAVASLPATDPTGGATFLVFSAEAKALGLTGASTAIDGYVGLNSSDTFSWSQSNIASGTKDAVALFEHEISEDMGRSDNVSSGDYTLLDMFHYTAADGLDTDAPGSPAGALDEPFVPGYTPNAFAYFSYDGKTVTLPYDTPAQIAAGDDVADWGNSVVGDAYSEFNTTGAVVSPTDLEEMNVLGYDLAGSNQPIISGTIAGQQVTDQTAVAPFSNVAITDPAAGQTETVTVTSSAPANGILSNLGGGSYNTSAGVYIVTGSAAAVTAALNGLAFTPIANLVGPGKTVTTAFTIGDTDSAGLGATNNTTSIVMTETLIGDLTVSQQLELIYIGYFNRAADGPGFNFWEGQNAQAQASGENASTALTNIANAFTPQAETIALYPFLTTAGANLSTPTAQAGLTTFIAGVYQNLFDHAADSAGAAYWLGQITSGVVGLGSAILAIANGATGTDATELQNKITVATDFTNRTSAAGLNGTGLTSVSFLATARGVLSGVDGKALNDSSVTAGEKATTAYISGVTTGASSAVAAGDVASLTSPIVVSASNISIDPAAGNHAIQFIVGAGADTLVLHANGVDQVSGFDPGTDALDLRSLLSEANVNLDGDVTALNNYLTVVDQGSDALLNFDPSGHGGGATIAGLQGLGGVVAGLDSLIDRGAVKIA